MKLTEIFKKHTGKFALLQPLMRDSATNKPLTFKVLNTFYSAQEAVKAEWYYLTEGFSGVFIYPCMESADGTGIEPRHTARMFRVLLGRE